MLNRKLATLVTLSIIFGQATLIQTLFAQADTQLSSSIAIPSNPMEVASVISRPGSEPGAEDVLDQPPMPAQPTPDLYTVDLGQSLPTILQVIPQNEARTEASLSINGSEILRLQGDDAYSRVKAMADRLNSLLVLNSRSAIPSIRPGFSDNRPVVKMDGDVLMTADTEAARAAGTPAGKLAYRWANKLRQALGQTALAAKDYPKFAGETAAYRSAGPSQNGLASWYGPGFHGHRTASGARFDQFGLSAAHRSLPFGTLVRVTNQHNRRSCVVKINDRGPYAHNRIIDLSQGAAKAIGLGGVGRVSLEVVHKS